MSLPLGLLDAAGTVALLLWGVRMVQTGVQRAFGPRLQRFLATALRTRLHAALAGMGVTAALQSSTATGLMMSRFVADGSVLPVSALAAVLGGGVGTALVVQVLSFDLSHAAWAILLLGAILFRRRTAPRVRDLGRAFVGLGLMLLALRGLVDLATPLARGEGARAVLNLAASHPALAMGGAGALAWAAHSSVAVVLLTMPLAANGILPLPAALAAILGANLGTALNLVLEGARDPAARRLSLGILLMRFLGCAALFPLLDQAAEVLLWLDPAPARLVANFHTGFNFLLLAAFLPWLGPLSRGLLLVLPNAPVQDAGAAIYLNVADLEFPPLALEGAEREALRMASLLEAMMSGSLLVLEGKHRAVSDARHTRAALEQLHAALRIHLAALDPDALTEADRQRVREIFTFATNIGRAGDALDRGLLHRLSRDTKRGTTLTPAAAEALYSAIMRLQTNLRTAMMVFTSRDTHAARYLAAEKQVFRAYEDEAVLAHLPALRPADADEVAAVPLELLSELKRVNGHLVASSANAILEAQGELLPSRVMTSVWLAGNVDAWPRPPHDGSAGGERP